MKRDMSFLVRQLKVKNSIAYHFSYPASLRMSRENHSLLVMYRLSNSELIQRDGRRKMTAKRTFVYDKRDSAISH